MGVFFYYYDALEDVIEAANGKPVLIFYWYQHDLTRLKDTYPEARQLKTEQDIVDWNAGKIPILLAHPGSAGHGLNLQEGGNTIVWFSLTWSLELYQQAIARLDRQGQTHAVIVHHLVEDILAAISAKDTTQSALITAVKARLEKEKAA